MKIFFIREEKYQKNKSSLQKSLYSRDEIKLFIIELYKLNYNVVLLIIITRIFVLQHK